MLKRALVLAALLLALPAHAHIGSPDTFVEATAGPYKFLVTAHPPAVYPGALELDLRLNPGDRITAATVSLDDGQPVPIRIFDACTATASIWLPDSNTHTLHILLQGNAYDLALPSAAMPSSGSGTLKWLPVWIALGLAVGVVVILLIARKSRSTVQILLCGVVLLGIVGGGIMVGVILHTHHTTPPPTSIAANLAPDGTLDLTLTNPAESFADLVPDDGKLMHLFLIRQPQQDVFLHLHPQQLAPGHFTVPLPAMPPGTYRLFADFYHAPGGSLKDARGETATIALDLPAQFHSSSPAPDDTIAVLQPGATVAHSSPPSSPMSGEQMHYTSTLRDGYTLQLLAPAQLHPQMANLFQVSLLDPAGHAPADMALYLSMPAHAVVVRSDNAVFAHIHPGGTLPMLSNPTPMPGMSMPMDMPMPPASNTAAIPYGFPSAGRYRLFIQMKHGIIVETAAFDLDVSAAGR